MERHRGQRGARVGADRFPPAGLQRFGGAGGGRQAGAVGGVAPQTLPPLRQSRVAIGGNSFGAAETPVEIHWRASNAAGEPLDEAHFIAPDGSFRSTIVTTGTVMTDTRIEADAPRVRQPASREGSFAILEELVFLPSDGRQVCAVLAVNAPIQFRITAPRDVVQQLIELAPMADFIKYRAKEPSKGFIDETLAKALGGFKLGADPAHVQGIVRLDPKPGRPPTFVVSANDPQRVHFSYRRYVENQIRQRFGFRGTPIRVRYRPKKGRD